MTKERRDRILAWASFVIGAGGAAGSQHSARYPAGIAAAPDPAAGTGRGVSGNAQSSQEDDGPLLSEVWMLHPAVVRCRKAARGPRTSVSVLPRLVAWTLVGSLSLLPVAPLRAGEGPLVDVGARVRVTLAPEPGAGEP